MEIVEAQLDGGKGYVFAGPKPGRPLSSMAMAMLLRRMKSDITVHGFRSTFRDWASETTGFSHEVCEMALADHAPDSTRVRTFHSDRFSQSAPCFRGTPPI
jgi:integrase